VAVDRRPGDGLQTFDLASCGNVETLEERHRLGWFG
jgi:hypothetical protein